MIECRNGFCLYNVGGEKCMFNSVTLNELGVCEDCLLPTIPEDELEEYKNVTLNSMRIRDLIDEANDIINEEE